ncbi:MAG: hypothetical protein OXE76_11295, partial [Alphaproteobacteria bacterium]|nr:hypothetical protein [Alphaproteobacteria bacterium]
MTKPKSPVCRPTGFAPGIAKSRAGYDPERVWRDVKSAGGFSEGNLLPFLTFPFDERWIYYETGHKWLNRARPEFDANLSSSSCCAVEVRLSRCHLF